MTSQQLSGRVVVVAGEAPELAAVAAAAARVGASVAVVSRTLPPDLPAAVRFRADASDPATWERVAMHVEQHLGPVDGVATDWPSWSVVELVFGPDLTRRGHGDVIVVATGSSADDVLNRMVDTRRAEPPPPPAGDPRP